MTWANENRVEVLDTEKEIDVQPETLTNNTAQIRRYVPIKALPHTPPYKIHKYFARRPWNVFSSLIDTYSDRGDIILDPFCGGGVTIYEGLVKGRRVMGFDLNPLSILVVENMVKQIEQNEGFTKAFEDCVAYLESLYDGLQYYQTDGKWFKTEWYELTFRVVCNHCGEHVQLSNKNKVVNGVYRCSNSNCESHNSKRKGVESKNCERIGQDYLFRVAFADDGAKDVTPVDEKHLKDISDQIQALKKEIKKLKITIGNNVIPRNWDRQFEDQLFQKGIKSFQDFFTERNLLLLNLLLHRINGYRGKLSENDFALFRLCFSNTLKDTSIMSFTNDRWQSGRPTSWSKHAYWVPSQFCELNIIKALKASLYRIRSAARFNETRKLKIRPAMDYNDLMKGQGNMLLVNSSITLGKLPDQSVDAIITDPPYGSNVQYLELSHFWYPWNSDLYRAMPDFSLEAISNRKKNFEGSKSMYDYEDNLLPIFAECHRVIKEGRHMVLTFNNKDVSAWLALLFAIFRAGFTIEQDGLFFQDGVKNYRQTAHTRFEGSPYGDFIYSFKKAEPLHRLKKFYSEESFRVELDGKFKQWISGVIEDKNSTILEMFFDVIPLIKGLAKVF